MKTDFLKTKKEITSWLNKHNVEGYTLVEDLTYGYTVNVEGDVNLSGLDLNIIPVKFNVVGRDFLCYYNQLTSLEFCPTQVGRNFYCSDNKLTSLEFCPTTVGGCFYCHKNQLKSLKFCPTNVSAHFSCQNNQLTSLEFCPSKISGSFDCSHNQLTSLEFCPSNVVGHFHCQNNILTSFEFCPQKVGGIFYCDGNPILKDVQKIQDFSEIFNLHQETLIKIEKQRIEQKLRTVSSHKNLIEKTTFKV